ASLAPPAATLHPTQQGTSTTRLVQAGERDAINMRRFKAAARTTKAFVVLLAVLALGSLGVGVIALAAPSVPAPTIISGPANPTTVTSATFTYTDSGNVTS